MSGQSSAIQETVRAMAGVRVCVVGDVILDHFVEGRVDRISPEAPIPVLAVTGETAMLGGAGNVVRNLVGLGASVDFVSVIGEDAAGDEVRRQFGGLGIASDTLFATDKRRTPHKTRFRAAGQQMLRVDHETAAPLLPDTAERVVAAVLAALAECQVLVLSDYDKGVLAEGLAARLIALARQAGKPVLVDPKGADFGIYQGADAVTPNRAELAQASGRPVTGADDAKDAARALIAAHGFGHVLATLGAGGMALVPRDGPAIHLAAEAREVFDVSGAGDTVIATLAAGLAAGADWPTAAATANMAAGLVVGKSGTAAISADELIQALHHQELGSAEAKTASLAQALARCETWRRRGLRIGFTNGCFDLLHPGHVSLLAQARAACDRLVVGVNSDASVKRLEKDGQRPVQSETARATVLASLASVDLVVVFGEDTPLALIEALRPDALVKGADYRIETVVGADLVQSYGGRVVLAELLAGHSTTDTIRRANGGKSKQTG